MFAGNGKHRLGVKDKMHARVGARTRNHIGPHASVVYAHPTDHTSPRGYGTARAAQCASRGGERTEKPRTRHEHKGV